jgi:hypothetical protein
MRSQSKAQVSQSRVTVRAVPKRPNAAFAKTRNRVKENSNGTKDGWSLSIRKEQATWPTFRENGRQLAEEGDIGPTERLTTTEKECA